MPLINLKFRSTNLALTTNDGDKVLGLAERFNQRMDQLAANTNNNATDHKLALMAALVLEDELEQIQNEVAGKAQPSLPTEDENMEMLCDTLDQISIYIEQLAEKIEKR